MSGWFSRLGEPGAPHERGLVEAYLRGLGIRDELPLKYVPDWDAARAVVTDPAWDSRWWDAEQREKKRLHARAVALRGETALLRSLATTFEVTEAVQRAAASAAARAECSDVGLVGSAAGAASEALHLAELAELAGEDGGHPFRAKCALFATGRWPLGILTRRYCIF
jgi:hypothetical protein